MERDCEENWKKKSQIRIIIVIRFIWTAEIYSRILKYCFYICFKRNTNWFFFFTFHYLPPVSTIYYQPLYNCDPLIIYAIFTENSNIDLFLFFYSLVLFMYNCVLFFLFCENKKGENCTVYTQCTNTQSKNNHYLLYI